MELHAGKYRRADGPGGPTTTGPCRIALEEHDLIIQTDTEGQYRLYYSDIDRMTDQNYELTLTMADGRLFTLFFLGTWYGQCLSDLRLLRGAQLTRNLAMLDGTCEKEFRGAYTFLAPDGTAHADRSCRIALYRTSLVVEPASGDFWSAAYADIERMAFNPDRYTLDLTLDLGEQISFSMLGTRFGELEKEIRRLTAAMYDQTAQALAARGAGAQARELAQLLRQGKAVRQEQVTALAPDFWPTFAPDRQAALDHLRSLTDQIYIGFRDAFGGGEPVYWYVALFPEQGAMAVEVPSEEGNATYIYRLDGPVERAVALLSRAMVALNFRREVISGSEAALQEGHLARYRVAVRKLPYVRRLRELFVGKAAHVANWQERVAELISRR
ncbi:MAG: hypothetical protein K0R39_3171 [Symbiobacteriaceae bacterium]|jgi:hypothetical protein|nr:hypothetical protein [Symbiobacteriaceae bacterium]